MKDAEKERGDDGGKWPGCWASGRKAAGCKEKHGNSFSGVGEYSLGGGLTGA